MRIGILADVHEDLSHLRWAINVLREQRSDSLVVLGDVFELGHRLRETVDLLAEARSDSGCFQRRLLCLVAECESVRSRNSISSSMKTAGSRTVMFSACGPSRPSPGIGCLPV